MARSAIFQPMLSIALLASLMPAGCGEDTCVIINNTNPMSDWDVTFAVAGAPAVGDMEGVIVIGAGCDGGCGCRIECDCDAQWIAADGDASCEPLVDAGYEESVAEPRTLRFELHADETLEEPATLLRCAYRGTREPVPSDFRIEVRAGAGSDTLASPPTLVVSGILPR